MASTTTKKTCGKCSKGGGVATCDGCEQSFCTKHFIEHRQELSQQIDNIGQEHDVLRRDLANEKSTHPLLERINQWEQESITKIQVVAETARADLHQLLDRTKKDLKTSVSKMTTELQSCRESDDYTEIDINKWMEQLKEIRKTLDNPSIVNIGYDDNTRSAIHLIKVSETQSSCPSSQMSRLDEMNVCSCQKTVSWFDEKFNQIYGNVTLSDDGQTATRSSDTAERSCVSGICRYSLGVHHIRFLVERRHVLYHIFFGIVTSAQKMKDTIFDTSSAYGWWDLDYSVASGKSQRRGTNTFIQTGDEVTLMLDCENRQIQLKHHKTDRTVHMPIDVKQCPFPWKIVVTLSYENDCVRILR